MAKRREATTGAFDPRDGLTYVEQSGPTADLEGLARHVGVTLDDLHDLVPVHLHTTPAAWLDALRLARLQTRLRTTDLPVATLAAEAGYPSAATLVEAFRARCHLTPDAYRDLAQRDEITIDLPVWLDRSRLLAYLGRDPKSASEEVDDVRLRIGLTIDGQPLAVEVTFEDRHVVARADGAGRRSADAVTYGVYEVLVRLLGLHDDPRPFEQRLTRTARWRPLVEGRRGLVISQTRDLFDALLWVVAGQQVSLPVAFALRRRLTRHVGHRLDERLYAPPTPQAVAAVSPEVLRGLGFSARKAEYILGMAQAAVDGALDLRLTHRSAVEVASTLGAIRGLGPWSVGYLLMRAFGFADCVPVGDAALVRNLRRFFDLASRPDAEETLRLMAPFAPHRSLATFYLWALG